MDKVVLAVNPGSSSKKYALYKGGDLVVAAHYEKDQEFYVLNVTDSKDTKSERINPTVFNDALCDFIDHIASDHKIVKKHIAGVGIRVVAPGRKLIKNKLINEEYLGLVRQEQERAPLHVDRFLQEYESVINQFGHDINVYAISDSEFHGELWHEARNYAINMEDADKFDIYRFGYHGISGKSVVHQLFEEKGMKYKRMIICHLGSGSSVHAVLDGKSIDTSMGYSPLEGQIMATRSGDIDVAAALELKKNLGLDDGGLEDYLNTKSGLLGLSGSADIRELLKRREGDDQVASLALDSFVYRVRKYIGAYMAILGGIDALVFTATVGERSAPIRRMICEPLIHFGIELDTYKNDDCNSTFCEINTQKSKVNVLVVPADEAKEIARQTLHLLANQ